VADLTLRPLSTSELLSCTWSVYRRHFGLFVALVAVPQFVVTAILLGVLPWASLARGGGGCLIVLLFAFGAGLLAVAGGAASQGATLIALSDMYLGRRPTIGGSLSRVVPRLMDLIVLQFVLGIAIGIGLICLVVPGVVMALMWSLAIPVLMFENRLFWEATSRSAALTKGHRGRVFLVYLAVFAVVIAVSAAFSEAVAVWFGPAPKTTPAAPFLFSWRMVADNVASFAAKSLTGGLATIAVGLLYFDLRVWNEGFSLEEMVAELGETPEP
jgi:hypothetical protein